jgi:WD40 repeat protein
MGRQERQVDPEAGPVQRFAWELRQLRENAGRPSYRQLAARAHYSASMLSEAAAGLALPSLAVTLAYVRACDGEPALWEKRWRRITAELAGAPESEPPYLGLSTFQSTDADRFFGRAGLVGELRRMLAELPLVAVFGASGSGKSSLLRAGLLPTLDAAEKAAVLTPGADPMPELAAALASAAGVPAADVHATLTAASAPVVAVQAAGQQRLVLVVDQFEEVFTLCRDEKARRRFLDCLLAIAAADGDRVGVVLGVRADFYPHCARHPGLAAALHGRQLLVGPMEEADLRAVITGPAGQAGCRVEPALVEAVLADAGEQPGALPLVSHALLETWRRRQGRTLTVAGYRDAGGVADAIARTAERMYGHLDPVRQAVAQDIFLRLTALGEDTEDTRRRVGYAELLSRPETAGVLEELTAARLVTRDAETATVAHEVLIRRWPRLQGWLAADRDLLRAHRRLTEAAAEWEQHARDDAFRYRGARLALWEDRSTARLNPAELEFLAASRRGEVRELAARRRRTRWGVSVLSGVVVVVTALAALSTVQARQAAVERDEATSSELAAHAREQLELKPELSLLLARQAMDLRRTDAAEESLRQATAQTRVRAVLPAGQGQVFGVALTAGLAATSGDDGTVRVWQRDSHGLASGTPRVLRGHTNEVWSPVFSPDGRFLAACGIDKTVTLWDLADATGTPRVLRGHRDRVWTVAFSPDGKRFASTGDDRTVRLWDTATGAQIAVRDAGIRQLGLAFSPDGRDLATGAGDGTARIWPADLGGAPRVLPSRAASVETLSWSPDGRRLAGADSGGTVLVWAPSRDGVTAEPSVMRGQSAGTVETVAFSPDGRRIASGGSDGTVRVFNADGDADPLTLPGHDGPVWSVAFSPDGTWLASGGGDGSVRFWDPGYPGSPRVLGGHDGAVWSVATGPAPARRIVTGGQDGTVRLWNPPRVLRGHAGDVYAVAASADGRSAASAGQDGTVRVWDVSTGRATVLTGHTKGVWDVAFLPDGRVVSAGGEGEVRIWEVATRRATVLTGHVNAVRSVAASPDGRHVASAGRDGTVRLWDVATGTPRVLRGHEGGLVWRVMFSPDGRSVASGGQDGTVRLWDVAGSEPPRILRGHRGGVWSLSFSADGRLLVTSGEDGGLRVWRPAENGRSVVLRGFGSPVETVDFGPDGTAFATVHDDGTLRLAECDVCGTLAEVTTLAEGRTIRDFTAEEKQRYLG